MPKSRKISNAAAVVSILCLLTGSIVADGLVRWVRKEESNSIILERQGSHFPFLSKSGNQRLTLKEAENGNNREIWEDKTKVDIFHISYNGKTGETRVKSSGSDDVIAPGTSADCRFTIKNKENNLADYSMWLEAQISPQETKIPVAVRVSDSAGNWLLGSSQSWEDVWRLNDVKTVGSLKYGDSREYTISWQWPFEQGMDEEDSILGNHAVGEDIRLAVIIHTQASWEDGGSSSEGSGGSGGSSSGHRYPTAVKEATDAAGKKTEGIQETIQETVQNAETLPENTAMAGKQDTAETGQIAQSEGQAQAAGPEQSGKNPESTAANTSDAADQQKDKSDDITETKTEETQKKEESHSGIMAVLKTIAIAAAAVAVGAGGVAVLTPIILIPWRSGLYVTGLSATGSMVLWKRKRALIKSGRFIFNRIRPGVHTFEFCDQDGTKRLFKWKLKRDRKEGIRIGAEDGITVITAGKNIRAVELYMDMNGPKVAVSQTSWAAIDGDQVVYTPRGTTKPQADGTNQTPGGLKVDRDKKYTV